MQKIIIDTDPGQDDAVAILLALASPELQVLGITAVAGNVPLALTQVNARKIVELAGHDTPVFAGADAPLDRPLVTAEYVHGKTGLDGPTLPDPTLPLQDQHAVDFLIETLREAAPEEITLCTLGPLTNVALALKRAPDCVQGIKQIVAMGGGLFEGGNTTPAAEFNIYVDPVAAEIVFGCGRPITLMPLDVTHQVLTTRARVERLRNLGTPVGQATAELLDFFERFDEAKYGTDGGPLHDPNVIAWLLAPQLYDGRHVNVTVETTSPLTMGMTVADYWRVTDRTPNCLYIRDVDADGFFDLLTTRLAQL
ncbi:MAG: nucleoside hydrolase [Pseudomonadota bacterium]